MTAYCSEIDGWRPYIGTSTLGTLPWHPRLSQLVPHRWPAWQIKACQSMGAIWPCCFAVAIPGQNGSAEVLLCWSQCFTYCKGSQGTWWLGEVGFVQSDGKIHAVSFPQTQHLGRDLRRKEARQKENEGLEGLMAKIWASFCMLLGQLLPLCWSLPWI